MKTETRVALAWLVIVVMAIVGFLSALAQSWLGVAVAVAVGANGVLLLRRIRR
jgi:hypothetical protein